MKKFWVSWYCRSDLSEFEYHGPWWISGYTYEGDFDVEIPIVCAAVSSETENEAMAAILESFDYPERVKIEWRFVEARPDDWSPFSDRFRRADWMEWN